MSVAQLEENTGSHAALLLSMIEKGQRANLVKWMNNRSRADLSWLCLALASRFLDAEFERDQLAVKARVLLRENETYSTANKQLFDEKKELVARLDEWRDIEINRKKVA